MSPAFGAYATASDMGRLLLFLLGHGGWFAAYRTRLLLEPARGIGIVVMANSDNASPDAIADKLYREIARAGRPPRGRREK